jgi:hypothetical protein
MTVEKIVAHRGGGEARVRAEGHHLRTLTAICLVEVDRALRSNVVALLATLADDLGSAEKTVVAEAGVVVLMTRAGRWLVEDPERLRKSLTPRWRITGAAKGVMARRRMARLQDRTVQPLRLLRRLQTMTLT